MKNNSFWVSAVFLCVLTVGMGYMSAEAEMAMPPVPTEVDIGENDEGYRDKSVSEFEWVRERPEGLFLGSLTLRYSNTKKIIFKQENCPEGYDLIDPKRAGELHIVTMNKRDADVSPLGVLDPDLTITERIDLRPFQDESIKPLLRVAIPNPVPAVQIPGKLPGSRIPAYGFRMNPDTDEYVLVMPITELVFTAQKQVKLSDGNIYQLLPENPNLTVNTRKARPAIIPLCKKHVKCDGEDSDSEECAIIDEFCTDYMICDDGENSSQSSSTDWSDSSSSESSFSSDSSDSSSSESSFSSDSSDSSFSESSSDSSSSSDAYSSAWSSESSSACAWWDWYCNAGSSSSESSSYGWSSSESSSDSSSSSSEDWSSSSVSSESWQSSSF